MAISRETREALQKKSKESDIPYTILKDVFERGQAAWLTGSRPGIGMMQWAMARVNSFIRGSQKHDLDLQKKTKEMKRKGKK